VYLLDIYIKNNILTVLGYDHIILFFTFVIIYYYTYYTYRLVQISKCSPLILYAREKHTEDLKTYLLYLKKNINKFYGHLTDVPKDTENKSESSKINQNVFLDWRYNDLVENHLPATCEEKFPNAWRSLEKTIINYNISRNNLYKQIQSDILHEIEWQRLSDACYADVEHQRTSHDFAVHCYRQYVYFFENSDYYYNECSDSFRYINEHSELWFDHDLVAKPSKDESEKIQEIYREMIFNENTIYNYENKVEIINRNYYEVIRQSNNLKEMIEFLERFPLFRGSKCNILRDLYEECNVK